MYLSLLKTFNKFKLSIYDFKLGLLGSTMKAPSSTSITYSYELRFILKITKIS